MCRGVTVIDITKATRFTFGEIAKLGLHLTPVRTVFEA